MSAPFWSDNFDLDLLKVLPETPQILGPLAERTLYTVQSGKLSESLTHPVVWNHDLGMVAWFGSRHEESSRGPTFVPAAFSHSGYVVACTALEAFRDAWVHGYTIVLDHVHLIWNTSTPEHQRLFDRILWDRRGWTKPPRTPRVVEADLDELTDAVVRAGERLRKALA